MPLLLAMGGFAKVVVQGLVQWLSRRSLAEIICICLVIGLLVTYIDRNHWKHVATERQAQLVKCNDNVRTLDAQLRALSTAKNQQQIITQTRIVTKDRIITAGNSNAQKVETAPIAPTNCHGQSSKVVLNADL